MNSVSAPAEPNPGYWHEQAVHQLGLQPGPVATACEKLLWSRLVALQAAAYAVLSDVDDDGVAEAQDMAVMRLRKAVETEPQSPKMAAGRRVTKAVNIPTRRITTKK
ncbi:hypothetical protein [Polaromonas sp.]|uniref:hypothetical protein n=1 Tax=Polaromonas sp. TaxID=1869339 RepID=UPI00352B3EF8